MTVLTIIFNIIILLLILGVIIIIHELGHFFVAKLAGVLCHEFSIGMGPLMWQKKKKKKTDTDFSIRWIPLGGYVAMAGEDESDSYFKTGDLVGLNLDKRKYVKEIVLDPKQKSDVKGIVYAYNIYDDEKKQYITIKTSDDKLEKYYTRKDLFYILKKNKKYQSAPKSKSFEAKNKFPRFLILLAGPMMNFLLALILFIFYFFLVGKPTNTNRVYKMSNEINNQIGEKIKRGYYLKSITYGKDNNEKEKNKLELNEDKGFRDATIYLQQNISNKYYLTFSNENDKGEIETEYFPHIVLLKLSITNKGYEKEDRPTVGESHKDLKKQIKPGDVITHIEDVKVNTWEEVIKEVSKKDTGEFHIKLERKIEDNKLVPIEATIKSISNKVLKQQGVPPFLITFGITSKGDFDFFYSLERGVKSLWSNTRKTWDTLGALFSPKSGIGITDLSGPVGIFSVLKKTTEKSFADVIYLIAFLSLNIGFINLLPIPALDGGRILFLAIEAIIGRKLNKKLEQRINAVMIILLLTLMVFVIGLDIFKLIR